MNQAWSANHAPNNNTDNPEPEPQLAPPSAWPPLPGGGVGGVPSLAAMDRRKVSLSVPSALVAEMVTLVAADVVGVPLMIPVAVSTDRPAGRAVAPNEVGELVAWMV